MESKKKIEKKVVGDETTKKDNETNKQQKMIQQKETNEIKSLKKEKV